jgi:REP element-mobilizing transposase RayT
MSQSLADILVHLVFSTAGRRPWFRDPRLRSEVEACLTTELTKLKCQPVAVGLAHDHGHMGFPLARDIALSTVVRDVKVTSSKWLRSRGGELASFRWQNGFGAFSVSSSRRDSLVRYVQRQIEHHRTETFQDELRRLLNVAGIAFDERYVWD